MKYKYCIIGSGIGGGMLLQNLLKNSPNESVAIVEAGGMKGKKEDIYESTGLPFRMITTSVELGGTSNLWHGVLSYLDDIDFEKRDWIPNSGWPIKKQDLMPYYKEAARFFGVENIDYFEEENLDDFLKESMSAISYNKELLENKLFQQPKSIKSLKPIIKDIEKKYPNAKLYINHPALELLIDEKTGTTKSCKVGNPDGTTQLIEAENFILCAGALETPRIMLNSPKLKNKNIGRYLMDHPMGNLLQMQFKKPQKAHIYSTTPYGNGTKIKTGLVFREEIQKKYKLPNHNFYIRPSFVKGIDDESERIKLSLLTYKSGKLSFRDIKNTVTNFNIARQILTYKLSLNIKYKYADLFFMTEQVPNWDSFVGLSDKKDIYNYPIARVHWALTEYDIENMKQVFKMCREEFFSNDDFIFTHDENDFFWENIFTSGAHHVGTTRMSETAEDGVVDKNLKVFDTTNLYVCDGSVFPTGGNVNIGLTIAAMAIRLSEFLNKAK